LGQHPFSIMRIHPKFTSRNAQAALEYMLLLAVVVAIVLVGLQNKLPRANRATEQYFNETANIIMGQNPSSSCTTGGWTAWTACSLLCGSGGTQTRTCTDTCGSGCAPDQYGSITSRPCNQFPCPPVDCQWDPAGWSACPACVNPGQLPTQTRQCICPPAPVGQNCIGAASRNCNFNLCPTPTCVWDPWSACSLPCGGGVQTRTCTCPPGVPPGSYCPADGNGLSLTRACNTQGCDCLPTSASPTCGGPVTIPANNQPVSSGSVVQVACGTGCLGFVTFACNSGFWNFVSETCTVSCGNNVCDVSAGENSTNCCQDCHGTPACGDTVCCAAGGEDRTNCCADCASCGDTFCDAPCGENSTNCCQDCGAGCGDGICCSSAETNTNCCDCVSVLTTGDGLCCANTGEDATNSCDCVAGFNCGDGLCCAATGEDINTCVADCLTCPTFDVTTCGGIGMTTLPAGTASGTSVSVPCDGCSGSVTADCVAGGWTNIDESNCCYDGRCFQQADCTSCESLSCCGWCDPSDPNNPSPGCCSEFNSPLGTCSVPCISCFRWDGTCCDSMNGGNVSECTFCSDNGNMYCTPTDCTNFCPSAQAGCGGGNACLSFGTCVGGFFNGDDCVDPNTPPGCIMTPGQVSDSQCMLNGGTCGACSGEIGQFCSGTSYCPCTGCCDSATFTCEFSPSCLPP